MIIRILFYAIVLYAIYYALKGLFGSISKQMDGAGGGGDAEPADDEMIVCPECGTYFPSGIGIIHRVRRERLRFCGGDCAKAFAARGGPPPESESKTEGG